MKSASCCTSVLKALADETRWRIVQELLRTDRASVTDLVERLHLTQPNTSKHLRILRAAGIVVSEKEATVVWSRVEPGFRQRIKGGELGLDLGCCTFRFDRPLGTETN
jgi:DNA-binding transcriptional ArsR family regulator